MGLVTGGEDALQSIIPFDNPKHPRLPSNRFPAAGRTGTIYKAAQVAWITGKYLYKFRKKWLVGGLALSVGGSTLFNRDGKIPTQSPAPKFNKTRNRFGGRTNYDSKYKRHRRRCDCTRCNSKPHPMRYR